MHTICPIDLVNTTLNNGFLCFGSVFIHKCPKRHTFLATVKLESLEHILQTQTSLKVIKGTSRLSTNFSSDTNFHSLSQQQIIWSHL